jgi:hypothetical protein
MAGDYATDRNEPRPIDAKKDGDVIDDYTAVESPLVAGCLLCHGALFSFG